MRGKIAVREYRDSDRGGGGRGGGGDLPQGSCRSYIILLRYSQYIQAIDFVVRIIRTYLLINNHHMIFNIHTYIPRNGNDRCHVPAIRLINSDKSVHCAYNISPPPSSHPLPPPSLPMLLAWKIPNPPNVADRSQSNLVYRSIQGIRARGACDTVSQQATAKRTLRTPAHVLFPFFFIFI